MTNTRPCVGCGFCCKTARCVCSFEAEGKLYKDPIEALGEPNECPWLEYRDNRYWCKIADEYKIVLAIGEGCCSPMNTERRKFLENTNA